MRWAGCLKSRAALFTLVVCVLATLSGVAMYMLSTSSEALSLPRCWVFEGHRSNEILDCSKLIVALGHDPECRGPMLPERCCQLVTVITAKRCHCRITFPKPAADRLGDTHQQCLRRIEEGLSLSSSMLPPYSGTLVEGAKEAAQGPALAAAASSDSTPGLPYAPRAEQSAPEKGPEAARDVQRGGLLPESADAGGEAELQALVVEEEAESSWQLMSRGELRARAGGAGGNATADVRLFVGVLTAGKNVERRQAIRETWGSDPRLHRVAFFAAQPPDLDAFDALRAEAIAAGDLVVLPGITEHYGNITHQTLEILRAASMDALATHTLKVDDDSYVHVDMLMALMAMVPHERLFLGNIEPQGGGPHRDPNSQWYVSREEWPADEYPLWAHGAGYVLSKDLVAEAAAGAAVKANSGRLFKLEDIAVGSWVEYIARERGWRVRYICLEAFNFGGCSPGDVVSHYIRPDQARCIWASHSRTCCARGKG